MSSIDQGPQFRMGPAMPNQQAFIENAKRQSFSLGNTSHFVGGAKLPKQPALQQLGAVIQDVRGDGACWSRATWQCVFSQVLDDNQAFSQFINKIAEPSGYNIPEHLTTGTIHILFKLKDMNNEQRIAYLNHEKVDDTLVFFMRHVAAGYMQKTEFGFMPQDQLNQVRTNKFKYGGPEVVAFIRHFGLEAHYITKNAQGDPVYEYTNKGQITERINLATANPGSIKINKNCIYAANDIHYEYITFDNETAITPALLDQIESDAEFAVKLQAEELYEYDKEQEQIKDDEFLARGISNEEYKPVLSLKDRILQHLTNYQTFKKQHPVRAFFAKPFIFKCDDLQYILTRNKRRQVKQLLKDENRYVWYKSIAAQIRTFIINTKA